MKYRFLILAYALVFAGGIDGQKPVDGKFDHPLDSFQLGSQIVKVPPPEGFTNVFADPVPQRFIALSNPDYDLLAIDVPDTIVGSLKATPNIDLDLYTEVSVSKRAREMEVTPETFAVIESLAEKTTQSRLDPNGTQLKRTETSAKKGLKDYLGGAATLDVGQPKDLGFFDKQPDIFSQMVVMKMNVSGRKFALLETISGMNIKGRLIYAYSYKVFKGEDDADVLSDFIKKWTAAIVAANK